MKYWISQTGNNKLIIITDDIIYNRNPNKKKLLEYETQLKNGEIPQKLTGTPFRYIKSIETDNQTDTITIAYGQENELKLDVKENKYDIMEYLRQDTVNQPTFSALPKRAMEKISQPILFLLGVFAATYFLYDIAYYTELGYTYEVEAGAISGLLIGIAQIAGVKGLLFIAASLTLLTLKTIWSRLKTKTIITKLVYR